MTAKRIRPIPTFVLDSNGTAELRNDADKVLWASDDDPDLADELGTDFIQVQHIGDVLEYLLDIGVLSGWQRKHCYVIEPEDEPATDLPPGEPLEGEYIPANDEEANA